ncbi:hypothetical protein [Marinobacter sp. DY40_1A1]|uniref:hypothetical protein n=1 Tax=Marinobacter sp. DY40_1A1 TaxID=2583229 RepID=UPI001D11E33B|nr:hypothetical protein [Marinobacter sp. DY40_1A1]MBK1887639.1 hypothetical protein [Marinobacter sp. DY40_1A1]
MKKRKVKSLEALRQQHEQLKKRDKQAAQRNAEARKKIELRREEKLDAGIKGIPQWNTDDDTKDEFEQYLLKTNLRKMERSRRIVSDELKEAIANWSIEELNVLWGMRDTKLSSQADAAVLLAYIRYHMGIDSQLQSPDKLIDHDSIKSLEGGGLQLQVQHSV